MSESSLATPVRAPPWEPSVSSVKFWLDFICPQRDQSPGMEHLVVSENTLAFVSACAYRILLQLKN